MYIVASVFIHSVYRLDSAVGVKHGCGTWDGATKFGGNAEH